MFQPDGGRKQLRRVEVDGSEGGGDAKLAEHRKRDFERQQGGTAHCSARHEHTLTPVTRRFDT